MRLGSPLNAVAPSGAVDWDERRCGVAVGAGGALAGAVGARLEGALIGAEEAGGARVWEGVVDWRVGSNVDLLVEEAVGCLVCASVGLPIAGLHPVGHGRLAHIAVDRWSPAI